MANQIQRLPVIEWQPEPAPVPRTYAIPTQSSTSDFGSIVSMIAIAAVFISGLTIAAVSSLTTQTSTQNYIHRSN